MFLLLNPRPFQKGLFLVMPAMRVCDFFSCPRSSCQTQHFFLEQYRCHTHFFLVILSLITRPILGTWSKKESYCIIPKILCALCSVLYFQMYVDGIQVLKFVFCKFFFLAYIAVSLNNQQVVKHSYLLHLSHTGYIYEECQKCDNSFLVTNFIQKLAMSKLAI